MGSEKSITASTYGLRTHDGGQDTQLTIGQEIEIRRGCLRGVRGILVDLRKSRRVILSLSAAAQGVFVESDCDAGRPLGASSRIGQGTDAAALNLKRRIIIFLSQKGVSSVRRLSIDVTGGTVTFRGTVASFYERQLCLSCQFVHGVREVVDDLKVIILPRDNPQERSASALVTNKDLTSRVFEPKFKALVQEAHPACHPATLSR